MYKPEAFKSLYRSPDLYGHGCHLCKESSIQEDLQHLFF
jgi:hypothetical protein